MIIVFSTNLDYYSVKVTESGWTDDNTAVEWFCEVFIPHATARNQSGKQILLMFDGHHSHDTPEMLSAAFDHGILLYCCFGTHETIGVRNAYAITKEFLP